VKGRKAMTRKKFVNAILEAICNYGGLAHKSDLSGSKKFVGLKAGLFYGVDEDGKSETDHYILVELSDGSFWRVLPERALKLEDHEQRMWDEFKRMKEDGELDDMEDELQSPEDE
jgi:hypothetical protein